MKTRKKFLVIACLAVITAGVTFAWYTMHNEKIKTFEACAAKYPVRESYPEVCATPDGQSFTNPMQRTGHGGPCDDPTYAAANDHCKLE